MRALRRRWALVGPLAFALAIAPVAARGDDATARARAAYDAALQAAASGRSRDAAELFRQADQLAPNPVALRSALRAAVEADDAALVMAVVASADGRALDDELRGEIEAARLRFAPRSVPPEPTPPAPPVEPVPAPPPGAPPSPRAPAPGPTATLAPDDGGLSPAWFFGALGVTAGLGVVTIVSGQDTRSLHEEFERTGRGAEEGRDAQLRTNVLFGVTAAGVVATTVLGVVTLASSGGDEPSHAATALRLSASPRGGALAIVGTF